MWVNKIKGFFVMFPPAKKVENISTSSLYLESGAYDWFMWWLQKTSGLSVNSKMFTKNLFKRFHNDEEDNIFNKFAHLCQIRTVNEYTHEWQVLATRVFGLIEEHLLKMYIAGLKPNICK